MGLAQLVLSGERLYFRGSVLFVPCNTSKTKCVPLRSLSVERHQVKFFVVVDANGGWVLLVSMNEQTNRAGT